LSTKKLIILVIVLLLVIACGAGMYRVYWCILQGKCPQKSSEEVDNIKLTIWSPKRFYEEDDTVIILVSIKNKRREEARLFPIEDQPALELTYRTINGYVLWHEQYPEIAYRDIIIDPGDVYELEIHISPEEQLETESGKLCARILVNYPGGLNGGYVIGTCLTYNNRPY
jgi:hypothetical protein